VQKIFWSETEGGNFETRAGHIEQPEIPKGIGVMASREC